MTALYKHDYTLTTIDSLTNDIYHGHQNGKSHFNRLQVLTMTVAIVDLRAMKNG